MGKIYILAIAASLMAIYGIIQEMRIAKLNKQIKETLKQNLDFFAVIYIFTTLYGALTEDDLDKSVENIKKYGAEIYSREMDKMLDRKWVEGEFSDEDES